MNSRTLLLVDYEVSILRSCARDLRERDFQVTIAANGDEAILAIWQNDFDAIITDLVMPGFDGLMVLQAAKQRNPESCVILLTGHGDLTSAVAALRLGADDYLLKPVESDELLLRLTDLLARQHHQRSIFPGKIITLCAYCRDIKDQNGGAGVPNWVKWEDYLTRSTGIEFSHGCCPGCFEKITGEWEKGQGRPPKL